MGFLVNSFIEFPETSFSPDDISGLTAWYDMSDISTITKDGSNRVSQVDDKASSFDLKQTTANRQPLWVSADQNGLDVLSFDDSARELVADSATITAQPLTMVVAYLTGVQGTQNNLYGAGCDYYDFVNGVSNDHRMYAGTVLNVNYVLSSVWNQLTNIYNGSSSIMRSNQVQRGTGEAGSSAQSNLTVGQDNNGSMKLGELLCYDSALSGDDLEEIETYLKDKWDTA